MALNFGLGFSFGARDNGLSRALSDTSKEFRQLGKDILSLQKMQTFLSALSFEKLDSLNDKLNEIGNSGLNLTTSLESTFTGFIKETKQFGATVGKSGAELSKFSKQASSMAYSLNIGADTAGKAIYGFEAAAGDLKVADILKATGIESATAFAKFADVAGVSGDDFAYSLLGLGKAAGLSADQVGRIASKAAEFGTNANILGDSLGSMEELTSILQERTNLGENADATGKFGEQIFDLANNLYTVTGQGKEAKEAAFSLAKTLTDSKKGFADLMAGVEGADLSDFTKQFSVVAGDADAAFAAMERGPQDFLKSVAGIVDGLSGSEQAGAIEFFRSRMQAVFGDSTDLIVGMLKDTEKRSAIATMEIAKDATTNLGKIAKEGFSTGLTTAEAYSRMQDGFEARLRAKTTVSTQLFLKRAKESFKDFDKFATEALKQGGLQGAVVETVANLQKFGAMAIIPSNLQGEFSMLGTAVDKLSGPIGKLTAMGIKLNSPLGMLTTGFGALAVGVASAYKATDEFEKVGGKKIKRSFADRFDEALASVGQKLLKFVDVTLPKYVGAGVKSLANALRTLLTGGLANGAEQTDSGKVAASLAKSLKKALKATWIFLKDAYKGFTAGLSGTLDANTASDAQVIGGSLGVLFRKSLQFAYQSVVSYATGWWKKVTDIWADGSLSTMDKLKMIMANSIPVMLVGAVALMKFGPLFSSLAVVGLQLGIALVTPILAGAKAALIGMWSSVIWPFLTGTVWPAITSIATSIAGIFGWWLVPIIGAVVLAFEAFRKEGESVSDALLRLLGPAIDFVIGMIEAATAYWDGFTDGLSGWTEEIINPLIEGWNALEGTVAFVFDQIGKAYDYLFGSTQATTSDVTTAFYSLGETVGNIFGLIASVIADTVKYVMLAFSTLLFGITQIPTAMKNLWIGVKYYLSLAWEYIKQVASQIQVTLIGAFNAVGRGITSALNFITSPIRAIASTLGQLLGAIASAPSLASVFGVSPAMLSGLKTLQSSMSGFAQKQTWQDVQAGPVYQAKQTAAPQYAQFDSLADAMSYNLQDKQQYTAADAAAAAATKKRRKESLRKSAANLGFTGRSPASAAAPTSRTPLVSGGTTTVPSATRAAAGAATGQPVAVPVDPALLNATNNPSWVQSLLAQMSQNNNALIAALQKQSVAGTGKPASPTVRRPPATSAASPNMVPARP